MSILPVVFYTDACKQKTDILKDNNKKSGIYRWTQKSSGKTYVGSAIDLTRRFRSYFSLSFLEKELRHGNSIICSSLLKYGYAEFTLEILEYCDPINIISREQFYLDNLNPEYNILIIARSSKGFKHSVDTKELLRTLNLNRIISDDTKLKISNNNSQSKAIVIRNIQTGSEVEFSTIAKASSHMGISPTHFNYHLSKQPVKGIYLVVMIGGIDVQADYVINNPSANSKSIAVCVIKKDSGVSTEFSSITNAAEFLGVTTSFLSRCIREGKPCRGYNLTRK
jgi:hypothetical protein